MKNTVVFFHKEITHIGGETKLTREISSILNCPYYASENYLDFINYVKQNNIKNILFINLPNTYVNKKKQKDFKEMIESLNFVKNKVLIDCDRSEKYTFVFKKEECSNIFKYILVYNQKRSLYYPNSKICDFNISSEKNQKYLPMKNRNNIIGLTGRMTSFKGFHSFLQSLEYSNFLNNNFFNNNFLIYQGVEYKMNKNGTVSGFISKIAPLHDTLKPKKIKRFINI